MLATPLHRLLLVLLALLGAPAAAQGFGFDDEEPIEVWATASATEAAPGDVVAAAIVFDMAERWHINSHDAVAPPELAGFAPIRTSVSASASGADLGAVQWPEVHEVVALSRPIQRRIRGLAFGAQLRTCRHVRASKQLLVFGPRAYSSS